MVSAIFSYNSVIRNQDDRLKNLGKDPFVKRETEFFTAQAHSITSIDDFLKNSRVFNYAMKAYGLEEMAYAKGLIRKILSDEDFAKKMRDPRYAAFRKAFDFKRFGKATMLRDEVLKDTVTKYKRLTLEEQIGQQNNGARLALYFERRISELQNEGKLIEKAWAYLLLGDKALAELVRTSLQLNPQENIDAQKKQIEQRLSLKDLKDPKERKKFITRFLALYDAKNEQQFSPALTLLSNQGGFNGFPISSQSLMALQNLRRFGH